MSRRKLKIKEKQLIEDRLKRINMKSKRKKTLLKKVIEFSKMFDMQVFLVMHDQEMNKVIEYNSGSPEKKGIFDKDAAMYALMQAHNKIKIHKYVSDDFFKDKYSRKRGSYDSSASEDDSPEAPKE